MKQRAADYRMRVYMSRVNELKNPTTNAEYILVAMSQNPIQVVAIPRLDALLGKPVGKSSLKGDEKFSILLIIEPFAEWDDSLRDPARVENHEILGILQYFRGTAD
jgi:hypothetical protein